MALIKCPECGKEISDKAKACINCGAPIAELFAKLVPVTFSREAKRICNKVNGYIFVDDKRVGTINNGESFTISVPTGEHRIAIDSGIPETMAEGGSTGSVFKTINIGENITSVHIECVAVWSHSQIEFGTIKML